jgi:regulator of replication initiation timing
MTTIEIVIIIVFVLFIAMLINQIRLLRLSRSLLDDNLRLYEENKKLQKRLNDVFADYREFIERDVEIVNELKQQLEELKK